MLCYLSEKCFFISDFVPVLMQFCSWLSSAASCEYVATKIFLNITWININNYSHISMNFLNTNLAKFIIDLFKYRYTKGMIKPELG